MLSKKAGQLMLMMLLVRGVGQIRWAADALEGDWCGLLSPKTGQLMLMMLARAGC